jgi:MFS family permease
VIALVALPEGRRTTRAEDREHGAPLRQVLSDRAFMLFLIATTAGAFVYFQGFTTFALHVRDAGHSPAIYGALMSLNGVLIVLVELPIVSVTRKLPTRPVLATAFVLLALGFALNAWATSVAMLAVTVVIWTFGEMISAPVATAYVADIAPGHMRGRYQGIYGMTFSIALVLGPALGARLYSVDPALLWLTCGALGLVSAGLVSIGVRTQVEPVAATAPSVPEVPGS